MSEGRTTASIQRYLDQLGDLRGDAPAEPIVRELLERATQRLHVLCATMLHKSYPRLARPPLNLSADEMLSGVVERMLKALRAQHPENVRRFFALANQHMRWELNEMARGLRRTDSRCSTAASPPRRSPPTSSRSARNSWRIRKCRGDSRR
jgi:RNA polymerase sigma-70 factor (ECF subfamily)